MPASRSDLAPTPDRDAAPAEAFSEKSFYQQEFRGRTLGILLRGEDRPGDPPLRSVVEELRENRTRVLLVGGEAAAAQHREAVLEANAERIEARIWRTLREHGSALVAVAEDPFTAFVDLAQRLSLYKAIRLADIPGVADAEGKRRSFVDHDELGQLLASPDTPHVEILRQIEQLLAVGVPNVNLCTPQGLHDELFTYSGSGTLFTRERYVVVRPLGIDDFDAADDLIARGVREGYLAPRTEEQIDRLLAEGFGAFVEGRHLAGIGALRTASDSVAAEVASLYTLTRFSGEGVGGHLVRYALDCGRSLDLDYVYACTTSERAGRFFERQGFVAVGQEAIPPEKWQRYDPERRKDVLCYRFDL